MVLTGSQLDEKKRKRESCERDEPQCLSLEEMARGYERLVGNSDKEKQVLETVDRTLGQLEGLLSKEGGASQMLSQAEFDQTNIKSSVEWLAKGQGTQGDIAKKGEEVLTLMLAYYKKLPKVMVSAPTKKESVSKAIAEKTVKGSSGAGEGGKGAKDLQGTVEMLEQRVKTLEEKLVAFDELQLQVRRLEKLVTASSS